MNKTASPRGLASLLVLLGICVWVNHARAVDALLLQDTYVDNGATPGRHPSPNDSNYGADTDLRVFKGNGRVGRAFLKFSLGTLPPGTTATHVVQARLRLWVNRHTTAVGSIAAKPVTNEWDEYKLTGNSADDLSFGLPQLSDLAIASIDSFVSIDVTRWVKGWLDGTLPNQGVVLEPNPDTDFLDLFFDSKESNETSHEARLEITIMSAESRGVSL